MCGKRSVAGAQELHTAMRAERAQASDADGDPPRVKYAVTRGPYDRSTGAPSAKALSGTCTLGPWLSRLT
jgi:hypothetical protein